MIIKNYLVGEKEKFIDALERELCKNGISYVKLNNEIDYMGEMLVIKEIHFLNRIIRVYDSKTVFQTIELNMETKMQFQELERNISVLEGIIGNNRTQERFIEFVPENEEIKFEKTSKPYQTRNKYVQKQESNKVKQMLKRYQR